MDHFIDLTDVHHEEEVILAVPLDVPDPDPRPCPLSGGLAGNPTVVDALARAPNLAGIAARCFLAARAPGTVRTYNSAIRKFQQFCSSHNLPFPDFTSDAVLQYVLYLDSVSAPFYLFKTLKPALVHFETAQGSATVFNRTIDLLIEGAERRSGAASGPVKKAAVISIATITAVLDALFLPFVDSIGELCAIQFRTIFRLVIVYHTLCRLNCFRQLRACHFALLGPDIMLTFPSAKNDQLHQGRQSCLAASDSPYCPVRVTTLFFRRFGLRFGPAAADGSFVNFQLRRHQAVLIPIFHRSLSATAATADLRRLLGRVGVSTPSLTDKSVKMAGVTAAFESGATAEDVMHVGRWQTPDIALRYKTNSAAFKLRMAGKVPSLTPT